MRQIVAGAEQPPSKKPHWDSNATVPLSRFSNIGHGIMKTVFLHTLLKPDPGEAYE
jgi:hypothetical protein